MTEARLVGPIFNSLQCMGFSIGIHFFHSSEDSLIRFFISNGAGRIKQGPAGQRCVREAHEAHEAYEANEANEAHDAHEAHLAISTLDWPNDFHRDNS